MLTDLGSVASVEDGKKVISFSAKEEFDAAKDFQRIIAKIQVLRGAMIDHLTLQRWVRRFARLISDRIRRRKKPVDGSWRMDQVERQIDLSV